MRLVLVWIVPTVGGAIIMNGWGWQMYFAGVGMYLIGICVGAILATPVKEKPSKR